MHSMLLALLTSVPLVATAEEDPTRRHDGDNRGNAAVAYWQAVECVIMVIRPIPHQADATFLRIINQGQQAPLDAKALEAIDRSGMALYFLHRGSRMSECDWGLSIDEIGATSEQGHLAFVPTLAGAACLRARYYFQQNKPQAAIDDLIAVLRLAKHTGNEGCDGTRALMSQISRESKVIEIAARHLPDMDAASANRICAELTPLPVREILKNFLVAQKKEWVNWSRKYAEHARRNDGDWSAYWREIGLRETDSYNEVGELLREASGGKPDRLLELANDAAAVFDQAIKLAELPEEKFRPAWRTLLGKSGENRIVEEAGREVEPVLENLILAETRRALLRSGAAVARNGPQALKGLEGRSGRFEYRELKDGFELISKHKFRGEPLKLVFEHSKPVAEDR